MSSSYLEESPSKSLEVKESGYAYFYFAPWTAGTREIGSIRDWIAGMTFKLERDVAVGFRVKRPA